MKMRSNIPEIICRAGLNPPYILKSTGKGFTLIELIMAVSILSIGIVLVLRSFLSSSGALGVIADRIEALVILEEKMTALKEQASAGTLKSTSSNDEVDLGNRKATYNLQITNSKIEGTDEELNEVRVSLNWQEDNKGQDEILAAYLENKKSAT